jgi:hypothetical protein
MEMPKKADLAQPAAMLSPSHTAKPHASAWGFSVHDCCGTMVFENGCPMVIGQPFLHVPATDMHHPALLDGILLFQVNCLAACFGLCSRV